MLAINEILQNRYRIISQLGQDGMGAVYEAEDNKRFGKRIALKEILISAKENLDTKQQKLLRLAFECETKILAALEHEAFPQVIDYFVEAERQFLVMELVQGEDLRKLLERHRKPFAVEDVLLWIEQLLDALDYLHTLEQPVYHRDIKPQNLKLTPRGRVKLLDFGIAKGADAGSGLTFTNQTFVAATLHYSPLEQIIKAIDPTYREFLQQKFGAKITGALAGKTDDRSDIYALGATAYHFLTNTLPVDSLKRSMDLFAGKPDPLPNPRKLNHHLPPAISDWILKAMEIERENRFATAKQMQEALRKIIEAQRKLEEEPLEREREMLREERKRIEAEREHYLKKVEEERKHRKELEEKLLRNTETLCDAAVQVVGRTEPAVFETADSMTNKGFLSMESVQGQQSEQFSKGEKDVIAAPSANFPPLNEESISQTDSSYLVRINFKTEKPGEPENEETVPNSTAVEKKNFLVSSRKNLLSLIAIVATVLLVFSSAGLGMWILSSEDDSFDVNNSEIISINSAPTSEPTVLPSVDPHIQTSDQTNVMSKTDKTAGNKQVSNTSQNINHKIKPAPKPAKSPKAQYDPCKPVVTIDCIINDN